MPAGVRVSPDVLLPTLAFLGVVLLLFLAHVLEPAPMPLAEAAAREGERVLVEGRVLHASGRHLTLGDGLHRMGAFAPREGMAARGDLVRAVGLVTRSDGGPPALSLDRLSVLEPATLRVLRPADLSERPEAFDGARVVMLGEVRGDSLVGGGARVHLTGRPVPDRQGDWLAVGVFHYRAEETAYVLRVELWSRPSS